MRLGKVLVLVALLALIVPQAVSAADTKNDLGIMVGYIGPTSDSTVNVEGLSGTVKAESTVDYGLAYKYKFRENMSFGASLLYAKHDVKVAGEKVATISNMPLLLDYNFHLLAKKNLYVGVSLGYAWWGDLKGEGPITGSESVKKNWLYGVNLGYDIQLGQNWSIPINVRYLGQEIKTDTSPEEKVTVNPVVANVGFAYRF